MSYRRLCRVRSLFVTVQNLLEWTKLGFEHILGEKLNDDELSGNS